MEKECAICINEFSHLNYHCSDTNAICSDCIETLSSFPSPKCPFCRKHLIVSCEKKLTQIGFFYLLCMLLLIFYMIIMYFILYYQVIILTQFYQSFLLIVFPFQCFYWQIMILIVIQYYPFRHKKTCSFFHKKYTILSE